MASSAQLIEALANTLNPERGPREASEAFLKQVAPSPGYPQLLMEIMHSNEMDPTVRLQAAVTFKNFINKNWAPLDPTDAVQMRPEDREAIKSQAVDLMCVLPERAQAQLSQAIAIIGKTDFPTKWTGLLPYVVTKFASGDFHVINGILRTVNPLFDRYRFEEENDTLWSEILLVLQQFGEPLTQLMGATCGLLEQHAGNKDALKTLYSSLNLIVNAFFSLISQELPDVYNEERLKPWMDAILALLVIPDNKDLFVDDSTPTVLDILKSSICDLIGLLAQKYDDDFKPYFGSFIQAVWNLLVQTDIEPRTDQLVCNAMMFLTRAAERANYKQYFPDALAGIGEKVVVPNMVFQDSDVENFQFNPEEYIRRDVEGSDVDTRRRSACDLVRGLSTFWEKEMVELFGGYIAHLLQEYGTNRVENWKSKDAAIFLITSLAVKGSTMSKGTTKTSELINIVDIFGSQILPELQEEAIDNCPVLKADALKFVITFRNQLGAENLGGVFPLAVKLLKSQSIVVSSYAAMVIEKILMLRPGGKPMITKANIAPLIEPLLVNLFGSFQLEDNRENEYAMKAIMRTVAVAKDAVGGVVMPILSYIVGLLSEIAANPDKVPTKAWFSHYMFETLSCVIRHTCTSSPEAAQQFEEHLFPPFTELLINGVIEYQPYLFQLMAQLLHHHSGGVPAQYMQLFPFLLKADLWLSPANRPALVTLINEFVAKGKDSLAAKPADLEALLGIFKHMIGSPLYDQHGFALVRQMFRHMSLQVLQQYLPGIFGILLERLSKHKTTKFITGLFVFVSLVAAKHGGQLVVEVVDKIQAGLFAKLLNRLLQDSQAVSGDSNKKTCAMGSIRFLTDTPAMVSAYASLWPALLEKLIAMFELPEEGAGEDEEAEYKAFAAQQDGGYKASFVSLAFASIREPDAFPEIDNPKALLAQSLAKLSQAHPGQLGGLVQQMNPQAVAVLQSYMQAARVQFA